MYHPIVFWPQLDSVLCAPPTTFGSALRQKPLGAEHEPPSSQPPIDSPVCAGPPARPFPVAVSRDAASMPIDGEYARRVGTLSPSRHLHSESAAGPRARTGPREAPPAGRLTAELQRRPPKFRRPPRPAALAKACARERERELVCEREREPMDVPRAHLFRPRLAPRKNRDPSSESRRARLG
jgi:hypothetical protein